MFTDKETEVLVAQFLATLEESKAGKAAERELLARKLTTVAREYLKGRYNAGNDKKNLKTGIVQLRDVLTDEDIGRR